MIVCFGYRYQYQAHNQVLAVIGLNKRRSSLEEWLRNRQPAVQENEYEFRAILHALQSLEFGSSPQAALAIQEASAKLVEPVIELLERLRTQLHAQS